MNGETLWPAVQKARNGLGIPQPDTFTPGDPRLVILAAGKGTRYGPKPKCVETVLGFPLASHTIAAFARHAGSPPICVVGHAADEVQRSLGSLCTYVRSANPVGGTAWALCEALLTPGLLEADPLVAVVMGDRVIPEATFARVLSAHRQHHPDLTMLARRAPWPTNAGKGRLLLGESGHVLRVVEESEINGETDPDARERLARIDITNSSLYVIRASRVFGALKGIRNDNAQSQYFLTDIVTALASTGGSVRCVITEPDDPDFGALTCDLTRPTDLDRIEQVLGASGCGEVARAASRLRRDRPSGQLEAIASQLDDVTKVALEADGPVGVSVAGGRLRLAFMHPDMVRFYGPAWQLPIGSRDGRTRHQLVAVVQPNDHRVVRLTVLNHQHAGDPPVVPSDAPWQYPTTLPGDWHEYEGFGTALSREALRILGYVEDAPGADTSATPAGAAGKPISGNLSRPFPLVLNALASLRTLGVGGGDGPVREHLFPPGFQGLTVALDGDIPKGGFSSSSAVTVATMDAINSLYGLELADETLVTAACQAEYGTGVRAGSLDQATIQMGRPNAGTVISSNPRDRYKVLGEYAVPVDTIRILFPYTVNRDREAWRWSAGCFGANASGEVLTAGEYRKLTGKAAEIAAVLLEVPLDLDLFKPLETDLLERGVLDTPRLVWIRDLLRRTPLLVSREELGRALTERRGWLVREISRTGPSSVDAAHVAERVMEGMMAGWREPVIHGVRGVPLRAMVAYLFGEVSKNFHMVHHTADWISVVSRSQCGDRWFTIDPDALPPRAAMEGSLPWETGVDGSRLVDLWLTRHGARPHDYNQDITDQALDDPAFRPPTHWRGTSFFRGLALIDLAEAMLWRAFGRDGVAVRVNAAGQGDYFQVHVDVRLVDPEAVKEFIRRAVYRRFGLAPIPDFVEVWPGGGAASFRLSAFRQLPAVARLVSMRG